MAIDPRLIAHYRLPPAGWQPPWKFKPPGPAQFALIAEIEQAFAALRLDGGTTWLQGEAIDNHEPPELIATLGRVDRFDRWSEVPDGLLASFPSAASFLDEPARRFYRPAVMRFELRYRARPKAFFSAIFAEPLELETSMTAEQAFAYKRFHAWYQRA